MSNAFFCGGFGLLFCGLQYWGLLTRSRAQPLQFTVHSRARYYYWAGYASGVDIISVNPSTFSVTVSAQSTATNFSVAARHPTEGWVYVATSSGIDRYSVSTSSVSRVESAASTTGTTLSLALSSSGKRLFRLTKDEFSMYSVSASGGLILLSQATVANAFRVTLMPYR